MSEAVKPCPRCGRAPEQFGLFDAYRCPKPSSGSKKHHSHGWNPTGSCCHNGRFFKCCRLKRCAPKPETRKTRSGHD